MIKFNLTLRVIVLMMSIIYQSKVFPQIIDNQDEHLNNEKILPITLKPKIKVSSNQSNLKSFNIKPLKLYLKKFIVIQSPELKTTTMQGQGKMDFKRPVFPVTDLGIDKDSSYVVGFDQDSVNMGSINNKILVSGLEKDNHLNYMLVKPDFSYYHPTTKEYLGTLVMSTGIASMVKRGKLSVLNIDTFYEHITPGTLVIPSSSLTLSNYIKTSVAIKNLTGYVLSVVPDMSKAAYNSVLIISLGHREGVKVGNIFKVLHKEFKIQDPYQIEKQYIYRTETSKGEILIYDVFDKLSLGIVIKSAKDIEVLDQIISS